jgi:catechol 2,3-dioxygenase-like lactoylglutathione lyase family enzyme
MTRYVHPTEQLVTEIVVTDISHSVNFYRSLGFEVSREASDFVELTWEDHLIFLAAPSAFADAEAAVAPARPQFPVANVQVMVPDVDRYWRIANDLSAEIVVPVGDRYYGLRDFMIRDPDGFGVRFASELSGGGTTAQAAVPK